MPVSDALSTREEAEHNLRLFFRRGTELVLFGEPLRMLATADELPLCTPYWWSQDIAQAVLASAHTLPLDDITCEPSLFIGNRGWYHFDKPLRRIHFLEGDLPLCAIQWLYGYSLEAEQDQLMIFGYTRGHYGLMPTVSAVAIRAQRLSDKSNTDFHEMVLEPGLSLEEAHADTELLIRFVVAASSWLRSKLLVPQAQPASRHARRRAVMEHRTAPTIQVVTLRKSLHRTILHADHSVTRTYGCRWMVEGHWRNQYYPSTHSHDLRFIDSYIKGPDDKPLKPPPGTKLYRVAR